MRIEGNGERLKLAHSYAKFRPLTRPAGSARMARMTRSSKAHKRRNGRGGRTPASPSNPLKKKTIETSGGAQKATAEIVDPRVQQQLKQYEEALLYFQHQKFHKAKQILEKDRKSTRLNSSHLGISYAVFCLKKKKKKQKKNKEKKKKNKKTTKSRVKCVTNCILCIINDTFENVIKE